MLKRIVAITFVALLSLGLAGKSIADHKKTKQQENQEQLQAAETFKKALQGAGQVRLNPKPDAGPKGGRNAPSASPGGAK